jgi:hypothetical protein
MNRSSTARLAVFGRFSSSSARRSVLASASVLAFAAFPALLAGCATPPPPSQVTLTYESRPEGAVLFQGTRQLGTAPITQSYPSDGKSTDVTTPEVTAVWPSGAKASFFTVLKVGADRVATLERPANAPNVKVDLDNAQKFISKKEQENRLEKEALAREIARGSDRCKQQMSSGNTATNDCQ